MKTSQTINGIEFTSGKTFFENIILHSIDLDGYDYPDAEDSIDRINAVYEIFLSEKGYEIERVGIKQAFIDWLQGLASALTVPFYYFEQIELAKKYGLLKDDAAEQQEDDFTAKWWANCADAFFTLKDNL